jgi:thiol-disulfide isomerase/thioredoxin
MALLFFLLLKMLPQAEQEIKIEKFSRLEILLQNKSDTTFVINFWATWCKPCIEELPVFDSIQTSNHREKVKVILVSLDFVRQYTSRLIPFIAQHQPKPEIFLLNEPDYNSWINKVDASWSGAIPATLVQNGKTGKRIFFERTLRKEEIITAIELVKKT